MITAKLNHVARTNTLCLAAALLAIHAGCGSKSEVGPPVTGEERANDSPSASTQATGGPTESQASESATSTAAAEKLRAGIRWFYAGEYATAIDFLVDAIEEDDSLAEAYYYRAKAWLKLELYDNALEDAARAIELEGEQSRTRVVRGLAKSGQGDHPGSIVEFTRAIEVDPQCEQAYYDRGVARYRLQEYEKAILDFDRSIDLFPDRSRVYSLRAECWRELGDAERAVGDLKDKLDDQPKSSALIIGLCDTYLEFDQQDAAIALLEAAVDSVPQDEKYYGLIPERLSSLFYQKGCRADEEATRDQALECFNRALHYDPEFAEAWFSRGLVNYRLKNFRQAIDDYREAVRFDPQDNFALGNLAGLLLECPDETLRDAEQALQYAKLACAAADEFAGTDLFILGKAHMANSQWEAAIPVLEKAKKIGPVRNEAACTELIAECRRQIESHDDSSGAETDGDTP